MMNRLALALLSLLIALPALGSSSGHFTGTSMPAGWTALTSGNGVIGMNGTLVAGSGGTPTAGIAGEDWINGVSAAASDVSAIYHNTQVSKTTNRVYWFD